jgi:hypothetical protein
MQPNPDFLTVMQEKFPDPEEPLIVVSFCCGTYRHVPKKRVLDCVSGLQHSNSTDQEQPVTVVANSGTSWRC